MKSRWASLLGRNSKKQLSQDHYSDRYFGISESHSESYDATDGQEQNLVDNATGYNNMRDDDMSSPGNSLKRLFSGKVAHKKHNNRKISDGRNPLSFSDRMRSVERNWYGDHQPGHLPKFQSTLHPQDFHQASSGGNNGGRARSSRILVGDIVRLGAALFTAGIFGLMIINPVGSGSVVKKIAGANPLSSSGMAAKACRSGQPILTSDFSNFDDVLSISPLGAITAPGEILPVPYIRINTKNDGNPFNRRMTNVLAPATADIVAIERRFVVGEGDEVKKASYTVHMRPCSGIAIVYDRLDSLTPGMLEKAGGLAAFSEIGGPDHIAQQTSIRVSAGMKIGQADGFDVALHDFDAEQQVLARPERYHRNNYARAELFNVSPTLLQAITPDDTKARCALDYLRKEDREVWSRKLGDAWGIRRAKGDNACRTALIDLPGTAQGAWFTDAAHNGATTKISAIALAPDTINPDRLVFALHGRLSSLTETMIGRPGLRKPVTADLDAASGAGSKGEAPISGADFVTFQKGAGLINRAFDEIRDDKIYCYEDMRVNFIGPRIQGVILLQKTGGEVSGSDDGDVLRIEARPDIGACVNVPLTAVLSEKATGFFR